MQKTITIGEKEITLKSSAATNILFRKAFKQDLTVMLQSYTKDMKELQKMQDEVNALRKDETKTQAEVLEAMSALMQSETFIKASSFQTDTLPKLTYIMYLEANETVQTIFSKLTEEQYIFWLMTIDQEELEKMSGEVLGIWRSGARQTSKPKN